MLKRLVFFAFCCATISLTAQTQPKKNPPPTTSGESPGETETIVDIKMSETDSSTVFSYVEESPVYPGGDSAMRAYIKKNLQFPSACSEMQGTVWVSFIIEIDGSLTDIKELKGIPACPDFSKEAIRIVRGMPKWSPGKINNRIVRTRYYVPVKFMLL